MAILSYVTLPITSTDQPFFFWLLLKFVIVVGSKASLFPYAFSPRTS